MEQYLQNLPSWKNGILNSFEGGRWSLNVTTKTQLKTLFSERQIFSEREPSTWLKQVSFVDTKSAIYPGLDDKKGLYNHYPLT